jgi:flagellar hook protein FlgE
MPVSGSLGSGVAALRSFSRGLEVLGSNIANSSTVGYKGTRIEYGESFNNIISRSSAGNDGSSSTANQVGTGVGVQTTQGVFTQGNITDTGIPSDLAISGSGYYQVRDPADGSTYITRAGNFRIDANGYLVTQGGLRVQGLTGGTANFIATGGRLGNGAQAPAIPAAADGSNIVGGVIVDNIVVANGGTGYDINNPPEVTIRGDGFGATGTAVVNAAGVITDVNIDDGGQGYTTFTITLGPPPGSDIEFTLAQATDPAEFGDVRISLPNFGAGGIVIDNQTDDAFTVPVDNIPDEDIEPLFPGLASYTINADGEVQLLLDTGDFFTISQVLLTDVADYQALVREGDNLYSGAQVAGILVENGTPGEAGLGVLQQGSLELSNVDLTEQFAELISTQRAFQAGSRIITTADAILQEVINLKR